MPPTSPSRFATSTGSSSSGRPRPLPPAGLGGDRDILVRWARYEPFLGVFEQIIEPSTRPAASFLARVPSKPGVRRLADPAIRKHLQSERSVYSSSVPRVSDARKDEVRNRLIDALVEVLLTEGPAAATSRRILQQAGLSAGALYHYFASLDELYEAAARRFTTLDDPLFAVRPDDVNGGQVAVETLADLHVAVMEDLFGRGDQVLLSQLRSAADTNGGVRSALQEYDQITVEQAGALNRASQEAGLFRADADADALVEVIGTFFEGFNAKSRATGFATSRERVLRLFLEMVCERLVEPDHPDSTNLRKRIEDISQP